MMVWVWVRVLVSKMDKDDAMTRSMTVVRVILGITKLGIQPLQLCLAFTFTTPRTMLSSTNTNVQAKWKWKYKLKYIYTNQKQMRLQKQIQLLYKYINKQIHKQMQLGIQPLQLCLAFTFTTRLYNVILN